MSDEAIDISKLAAALGRRGGKAKTEKKVASSRENVKKAREAKTPGKQSKVAAAVNAKRWAIVITQDSERGRQLWGETALPGGAVIVGTVERDRKCGALLKMPGDQWAMGMVGGIKLLPAEKVKAAMGV